MACRPRRQVSEFESADPNESRKENVGRTGENRGNRGGKNREENWREINKITVR